ncbi:MAG TPA: TetR-like C-terminal domain-containing protein [Actinocrinis sp.]|nr:TetR-like C-terminal domain-containing protein [Actinocrinis sp.]
MTTIGSRGSYHHGDLRNALAAAALGLARVGGPESVVLREAARQVGVSATAAYRHFAGQGDLLADVKSRALGELTRWIGAAVQGCDARVEPGELAVARLRSAARAYLDFAFAEPGLFAAAFHHQGEWPERATARAERGGTGGGGSSCVDVDVDVEIGIASGSGAASSSYGGADFSQTDAFASLVKVLDDLAACGRMPAGRRPYAEFAAWSAIHGVAVLFLGGPLRLLPEAERAAVLDHALETCIRGLTH